MTERPVALDPHPPAYVTPVPTPPAAVDDTHVPGPPPLPTGTGFDTERETLPPLEPLEEIRLRLASIEDALLDPRGLVSCRLAELDRKAARRHEETMRALTTLANGLADLSNRMAFVEPQVERHDAKLQLVAIDGHNIATGNAE